MRKFHFPWQNYQAGKIFISYRRDDSQWVCGRLSDSLTHYFGDDRVFRDIEDISAGADFSNVIENSIEEADAAVILIGPDWLTLVDGEGRQRIAKPDDWVAREIAAALKSDIAIYPVLVEDTPMPHTGDLPLSLQALTRYNAVTLNDNRWNEDVARLAKIIGLDVPSITERKLNGFNLLISGALCFSVVITTCLLFVDLFAVVYKKVSHCHGEISSSCGEFTLPQSIEGWLARHSDIGATPVTWPLSLGEAGFNFVVITGCSVGLFVSKSHIDITKKNYYAAAAWVGAIGTLVSFVLFSPIDDPYEPVFLYLGSTVTAMIMFALMNLSGFKPR